MCNHQRKQKSYRWKQASLLLGGGVSITGYKQHQLSQLGTNVRITNKLCTPACQPQPLTLTRNTHWQPEHSPHKYSTKGDEGVQMWWKTQCVSIRVSAAHHNRSRKYFCNYTDRHGQKLWQTLSAKIRRRLWLQWNPSNRHTIGTQCCWPEVSALQGARLERCPHFRGPD